jgi:hypothetical protein
MINKIINSEGQQYEPETISELVFDAKPIVNSFNAITSDAVARAVAGASGEVPAVTENDNGKVLTAIYDEGGAAVEWVSTQLPEEKSLESANNTISITEGTTTVSIDVANPIPAYDTTTDLGKVLQVTSDGLAWVSLT